MKWVLKARKAFLGRAALMLGSLFLGASCCGILPLPPPDEEDSEPSPAPTGSGSQAPPSTQKKGKVSLGTAAFPADTKAKATPHAWLAPLLKPSSYDMAYALGSNELKEIDGAFRNYAKSVRFKAGQDGKFTWFPPRGCAGDMHCVLEDLAAKSYAGILPIAAIFKRRAKDAKLDAMQAAALVVNFVQYIRYEIPESNPFGLMPPALVAYESRGDCDSKSLLAHMLLSELGIRSMLISSVAHKHAMLGIALPAPGTTFTHAGTRYAFTEMTAKGSPIGQINPSLLKPNDWKAVPLRLPSR